MRALVQRVQRAWVEVEGKINGQVEQGLLVYVGFGCNDNISETAKLAEKIASLRIFADEEGKLNLSAQDVRGGILVISNFTLMGQAGRGRRPDFTAAAAAGPAEVLYEHFIDDLKKTGCVVASGVFGAEMQVASLAHGPVNIIIDMPPQPAASMMEA
jgi:D-tyrosyl-tRNA(Tyr) deacylase